MRLTNIFLLVSVLFLSAACSKEKEYLPKQFFDLTLQQKLTGAKAEEFVNRLHFNPVTVEKNEVAFYNGSKGAATIYITYYSDEKSAVDNFLKMIKKISPENSPFIRGGIIEIDGEEIYRTFGLGQTHFVFVAEKSLFWISAETDWAQDFLTNYLKYIN